MLNILKNIPLFSQLSEKDLEKLAGKIKTKKLEKNKILFNEGEMAVNAYIIKAGELEVFKQYDGREVVIAKVTKPGDIIGELALLKEGRRTASVRSKTDVTLLVIYKADFEDLLNNRQSIVKSLFHTVIGRLEQTESLLRQGEKMAQIGVLTAGIAHELNNPASAVRRSSAEIKDLSQELNENYLNILKLNLNPKKISLVLDIAKKIKNSPSVIDDIKFEEQDNLEEALTQIGIATPWEISQTLLAIGVNSKEIRKLREDFSDYELKTVIEWLSLLKSQNSLFDELYEGAGRISEIVKALKSYVYLDKAPVQSVDIHQGIENTLVLLRHKLGPSIKISKDFDKKLPTIEGYGGELNQAWTNIIANAAEAMKGEGTLKIKTKSFPKIITIDFIDSGPGIPKDIQSKIFDPFFTTKEIGKGTGLGLHITYNTIVFKHGGDIKISSKPGSTMFSVKLPNKLK